MQNTNPIFKATPRLWAAEIDNADGTNLVTLVAAGNDGSLVEGIAATTDDTAAVEVDLYAHDGTNDFALGSVTVGAGAGTDGGTTPSVDALNDVDLPWLRADLSIPLPSGWSLKAGAHAAVTATKVVHLTAFGGDY